MLEFQLAPLWALWKELVLVFLLVGELANVMEQLLEHELELLLDYLLVSVSESSLGCLWALLLVFWKAILLDLR
jgi:hypothetical protein